MATPTPERMIELSNDAEYIAAVRSWCENMERSWIHPILFPRPTPLWFWAMPEDGAFYW